MSVTTFYFLVPEEILLKEKWLPLDSPDTIHMTDAYVWPDFKTSLGCWSNQSYQVYLNELLCSLLRESWEHASREEEEAIDSLFRFSRSFMLGFNCYRPFNELGLRRSLIMSPASARYWLKLYNSINFDHVRPLFDRVYPGGNMKNIHWFKSYDEVKGYLDVFPQMLTPSIETNRMLYGFAE